MIREPRAVHLLDVNILVALFDADHIHHVDAHRWFESASPGGWATCPLTENGFVRVVSNPPYPGRRTTVADAIERLRLMSQAEEHVFWPDDVSLLDSDRVVSSHLAGHREVTDTYLLALAVAHDGALATFDRTVRRASVKRATERSVTVISTGA